MLGAIEKIRLDSVGIRREESGSHKMDGTYSLISPKDKVVATQNFNGYSSVTVEMSSETKVLLERFMGALQKDVQLVLGFTEGKGE